MRFVSLLALFAVLISLVIQPERAHANSPQEAKAFTANISDTVLAIINEDISDSAKLDKLEALFVDVVDVDWVGRFVLGKYWRRATPEQQEAYLNSYRDFLIKHYVSNFTEYNGETYVIPYAREEREGEYLVRMEIQQSTGQPPILVDYRLREHEDSFKAFDIIVEGVSLITTQRSEFGSVVGRHGIDTLIAKLEAKTSSLVRETREELEKQSTSEKD